MTGKNKRASFANKYMKSKSLKSSIFIIRIVYGIA